MKNRMKILAVLLVMVGLVTFDSCKEADPTPISLVSATAADVDLNGATSPNNVAVGSSITITFTTNVDPATVTASNITLVRDYDKVSIPIAVSATGAVVTIDPTNDLNPGALFLLTLTANLKSDKGLTLTEVARNFTTAGTFAPDGAIAYWTFEGNANDVVSTYDPSAAGIVAITYVDGRKTTAGKAADFNGTTSIIEIANGDKLMNTGDWTTSFWVKASSTNKTSGHFVLGLGAFFGFQFEIGGDYGFCKLATSYAHTKEVNGTTGEDMFLNGDGKFKDNGGWQGHDFNKDLTASGGVAALLKDKWAHVVFSYNAASKQGILYINGEKMKSQDFDLWPDGDAKRFVTGPKYRGVAPEVVNELAFGFIQSRAGTLWDAEPWGGYDKPGANHFKGQLDDVIFYKKVITPAEITLMYNSGK